MLAMPFLLMLTACGLKVVREIMGLNKMKTTHLITSGGKLIRLS